MNNDCIIDADVKTMAFLSHSKRNFFVMTRLTHKRKVESFKILTERDGYQCFYCNEDFIRNRRVEFDHLNNNSNDSRLRLMK